MDIDKATLLQQYERAKKEWSYIHTFEGLYKLPDSSLYAIGSRETNLQNIIGDYGHGHGVFQLDNRSHQIPAGFDSNVHAQTEMAAKMLQSLLQAVGGNAICAFAAYNEGLGNEQAAAKHGDPDCYTTNHNYGHDVFQRMSVIHGQHIKDDHRP